MFDHDTFVQWAVDHFDEVDVSGYEVKLPDKWWRNEYGEIDSELKCWVNTQKGCYRAFKSERTGNIIEFVMGTENCTWDEALEILGGENSLRLLEQRLDEFLDRKDDAVSEDLIPNVSSLKLPPSTYLISSLPECDPYKSRATNYLRERMLAPNNLMICVGGEYKNRIVIPYYDSNGELIYFNSRSLDKDAFLRYRGPDKDQYNIGKGDVIWMGYWPEPEVRVYLTEGEFDAMALNVCGFNAAACGGKALNEKQMQFLQPYKITVAFDSDKAGQDGMKIAKSLGSNGFQDIKFVRPPKGFKDWNDLLIEKNEALIRLYIKKKEKTFNSDDTLIDLSMRALR